MKFGFLKRLSTHVFLAIVAIVMLLSISTLGLLTISQTISTSGNISSANVGLFSDSQYTQPLSSIDWGLVSPGESVSRTIYIKNTGNIPLTLNMTTSSWSPTIAGNSIAITWNREGTVLGANQTTSAALTLAVNSGISGVTTFSVNIVVSGTG